MNSEITLGARAFDEWLRERKEDGHTAAELAAQLGISRRSLYNYKDGIRIPSVAVAQAIERASRGAVPVGQWSRPAVRSDG